MGGFSAVTRRLLRAPGISTSVRLAERAVSWPDGRLCTLTYHRIAEPDRDGRHPGLISATPSELEHQLDVLNDRFNIVSLDLVLAARVGDDVLPSRAVLLTFDDAVDDFFDNALPALVAREIPAVLFVPTGFVGRPDAWFWWDAVHAAVMLTDHVSLPHAPIGPRPLANDQDRAAAFDELRTYFKQVPWTRVLDEVGELADALDVEPPTANVMSWSSIEEASRMGIAVCPHTRSHPHLDQLDLETARREIADSLDDLRRHIDSVAPAFAYPSGQWTPDVRDVVDELDFELAFTTERGAHHLERDDPLLIGRLNVSRRTGLDGLRLQLHPWADQLQRSMQRVGV